MRLEKKVAVITGSGTGIGKSIAQIMAAEGAGVVINYSKSSREAQETATELEGSGVKVQLIKADVSKDCEVREMMATAFNYFGRLDILVNNAGITFPTKVNDLESLTEKMWDDIFAVNVKGAFFCTRAISKYFKERGSGCIINITSAAGFTGRGSSIAYTATKAALISLTKSMALALAPEVQVNAIAPGFVPTRWHTEHEAWHSGIIRETPLARLAQPEDIARLALALATDAKFVTGQTIICDGGIAYQ